VGFSGSPADEAAPIQGRGASADSDQGPPNDFKPPAFFGYAPWACYSALPMPFQAAIACARGSSDT
jgi:hypothetical protein